MSDHSGIEWTEATWNPVTGCFKVSAGCKNCYAERDWDRLAKNPRATKYFGRKFTDVKCHPEILEQPLRWQKPRRIFVNSMSDLFHESVPDEFIAQVFQIMAQSKNHVFQVLTKRPDRMLAFMSKCSNWGGWVTHNGQAVKGAYDGDGIIVGYDEWPLPNVWLGVSVEDQQTANERIPFLLDTPAAVRWVSMEPLLAPVDLTSVTYERRYGTGLINALTGHKRGHLPNTPLGIGPVIDWVVVGGESGPKARPMHPGWVRSLRDQCIAADVPFFFKQWGEWIETDDPDLQSFGKMAKVGKKKAGRILDGETWSEYPSVLSTDFAASTGTTGD